MPLWWQLNQNYLVKVNSEMLLNALLDGKCFSLVPAICGQTSLKHYHELRLTTGHWQVANSDNKQVTTLIIHSNIADRWFAQPSSKFWSPLKALSIGPDVLVNSTRLRKSSTDRAKLCSKEWYNVIQQKKKAEEQGTKTSRVNGDQFLRRHWGIKSFKYRGCHWKSPFWRK